MRGRPRAHKHIKTNLLPCSLVLPALPGDADVLHGYLFFSNGLYGYTYVIVRHRQCSLWESIGVDTFSVVVPQSRVSSVGGNSILTDEG
jgi:hypothetical protein